MKIKNWDKWQTYRQDRGAPPWIKVHRNLMSNSDWVGMSDAEKGQLVSMWIVAADKAGHLPDDPAMIRKMCILDGTPDINKFKRLGFIDAKRMPRRRQPDAPEAETETEEPCSLTDIEPDKFLIFWDAFSYKKGKGGAESSWSKIKLTDELFDSIISSAKLEALNRPSLIGRGMTPKMAQGWLTERRWEDEQTEETKKKHSWELGG
jgi:hypothetical protein